MRTRSLLAALVVVGAYYGSAKLGLELSVAHGVITPVWPPTGIALASLLILGPRFWPAIAVGAFLSNATSGVSVWVAAAISVGNTLEALAGYGLLRRVGFRPTLERARDVLALTVLAGFVSTAIAATNGVTTLAIAGSPAASPYGSAWALWWLGDAMGDLLVAPLLLAWATVGIFRLRGRHLAGALAGVGLLAGTSAAIFLGGLWRYPYPLFPLLVWVTLRFRQWGAATGSLVVASFAVAGAVSGRTPLGNGSPTTAVQVLQGLLAFVAVSLLVLGATLHERDQAEQALRLANAKLEEAQGLAHVGSWEWEIDSDRVSWSPELFRIYGLDPKAAELDYDSYLKRIHPGDRDRARGVVERAFASGEPFEMVHRIVLDDGSERVVSGRGRVIAGSGGRPMRMVGTAQDVTERQQLEEVRENILAAVSHELRTPLTSILGFALTLRERGLELDEATGRKIVDQLARQSHRLEGLLSDLLDIDRLRHGRIHAELEVTDVGVLVERVAAAAEIDVDVRAEHVLAKVDPAKLERIVENLLANAAKHTPEGTNIAVSVTRNGKGVLICVDDDGPGVPDAHKQEIFGLFARGALDPNVPGTGIGLALVAQFTALQGGKVWVEDRPGGGSSFRVLLPTRV